MGVKNIKTKKKESLENKEIYKHNFLSEIPNPCFKKKEIFSHSNCTGFEIFKLKDIKNAFYFAFSSYKEDGIVIYKYFYEKEKFEKVSTIKFDKGYEGHVIIKYFYNPINKKRISFHC